MTLVVKVTYPGRWVEVCGVDELIDGEAYVYEVDGYEVYVVMKDGELRAYYGRCAHAFGELKPGDFDGSVITCSHHLWQYDALSGLSINPRGSCLFRFEHEVRDGRLFVKVPEMGVLEFKEKLFKMYGGGGDEHN
jgi:nitrite reductase/ring-hydroxylating ferredoxin subunit